MNSPSFFNDSQNFQLCELSSWMNANNQDNGLGDRISDLVRNAYRELSSACKPVTRSNGSKEWTVLAGMVAIDRDSEAKHLKLLSVATGVKALPDAALGRSCGRMVHDCHAEILALRGFNTLLLEHMNYLRATGRKDTDLIELRSTGNYMLKNKWQLSLYISALPCGDSSMNALRRQTSCYQKQEFTIGEDDEIQFVDKAVKTILRGRFNFRKLGMVRTKPGRSDSTITLSKSCSDKLCIKQVTSVLNCLTSALMERPVFLDYLVIPLKDEDQIDNLRRNFNSRLGLLQYHPIELLSCSKVFVDDKRNICDEPSSISAVRIYPGFESKLPVEQAILNGLRNGFYTKGKTPLRKNCETVVSRYAQWKLFLDLKPEAESQTYLEFKATCTIRNSSVVRAREQLSPDGWIKTMKDDVSI